MRRREDKTAFECEGIRKDNPTEDRRKQQSVKHLTKFPRPVWQKQKTERRKDLVHYNGVVSFEGLENNDDSQRWEENIVKHKVIDVMNHDEVDDDDTLEYDDQESISITSTRTIGTRRTMRSMSLRITRSTRIVTKSAPRKTIIAKRSGSSMTTTSMILSSTRGEWNAEWNTEEDECYEGKDDYVKYDDDSWDSYGDRCDEDDDDDMWIADMWWRAYQDIWRWKVSKMRHVMCPSHIYIICT